MKELQPLPYCPNRSQIYEMYQSQMSRLVIKQNLDSICKDYLTITKKIISTKVLPRSVWVEFYKCFGTPNNYQPNDTLLNEKTIFD